MKIDGNSRGSIDYPVIESSASNTDTPGMPHKPRWELNQFVRKSSSYFELITEAFHIICVWITLSLDVDLNILLPSIVEQLLLGKGRGKSFVSNKRSEIWRAKNDDAKRMIQDILVENFYKDSDKDAKVEQHTMKVANWFYAMLKKQPPWSSWTHDI